jgi:hypothetical protein
VNYVILSTPKSSNDLCPESLSIKGLVDGISSDEETFLRSLCVAVGDELELPNNLNQHWDDKLFFLCIP